TYAEAAHDGYAWKKPGVIHRRRLEFRGDCLQITDWLEGSGDHEVALRFHIHPSADVKISLDPALDSSREPGTYHPGFNLSVPNTIVAGRGRVRCPIRLNTTITLR